MSWAIIGIGHEPKLTAGEGLAYCGWCMDCAHAAMATARVTGSSVAEHRVEGDEHHWARVMRSYGLLEP